MRKYRLSRGETGNLEVWNPEGELVGYICQPQDMEMVLDFLLEEFPVQAWPWVYRKAQEEFPLPDLFDPMEILGKARPQD